MFVETWLDTTFPDVTFFLQDDYPGRVVKDSSTFFRKLITDHWYLETQRWSNFIGNRAPRIRVERLATVPWSLVVAVWIPNIAC
jgi:hypothetical protein